MNLVVGSKGDGDINSVYFNYVAVWLRGLFLRRGLVGAAATIIQSRDETEETERSSVGSHGGKTELAGCLVPEAFPNVGSCDVQSVALGEGFQLTVVILE